MPEEHIITKVSELSTPKCPVCGSTLVVRIGYITKSNGLKVQRFKCKMCGRTFTELEGTPLKGVHDIKLTLLVAYLMLHLRLEPNTIARITGKPYTTVKRISRKVIEHRRFFENILAVLLDAADYSETYWHRAKSANEYC
ncbi:hypothetical protein A0127_07365 [Thermococcus peptonophilus]|uniref:Uncharacterized protein n=2 Tax=Thermococcus peptonophilus TaxID=53952 RepID=A0A142CXP3_9EURY|nr:hypothetical protein A0127_07365 [Thermococcus peptonophilus]